MVVPVRWTWWFEDDAVGRREVPATVGIVVCAVVVSVAFEPAHPAIVMLAAALSISVMVVGLLGDWSRWPADWRKALPLVQMVAVALLDVGTGTASPNFYSLALLPVVSLAVRPGRSAVVLSLAGFAFILLVPVVVDIGREYAALRACVTFLIIAPLIVGVHLVVDMAIGQAKQLAAARDALAVAAQEVRGSRDTLASILASATEQGFLATDAQGVIVSVNTGAEKVFGRSAADLLGRPVTELVAADQVEGGTGSVGRLLLGEAADGGTEVGEWDVLLPDGTRRYLEIVVTPRPPLAGTSSELPPGYLFVATDVTGRHEEQNAQDEFIGLVSHELRTPLASILGYVDLLRLEEGRLDAEQQRYLDVVERSAHRLQTLVDDLLTSAQMAAGADLLRPEDVDVVTVVQGIVESQRPAAEAAGVSVLVDGDVTVPLVSDAQRLAQVVDNLVSNAVKYSSRGGHVQVTVTAEADVSGARRAHIRVSDEGRGIAADELEHVTERFYRTRATRQLRVRGVGLGLSLVQRIVDTHGGTMTLSSEPGVGTQVDVLLPDLPPSGEAPSDAAS